MKLTPEQFAALAELMRLRPGSTAAQVAVQVTVEGASIGDAARYCGTSYKAAHAAVTRVQRAYELACVASREPRELERPTASGCGISAEPITDTGQVTIVDIDLREITATPPNSPRRS